MNKNLLKKRNLLNVFFILSLILSVNMVLGQQVIGSFPSMDGGFEGQTSNPATLSGITSAQIAWTTSNSGGVGVLSSTGGRSGPKFMTYTMSGTSHRRLQSPTADMPLGAYRIQFWYQGDLDGTITTLTESIRGGFGTDGSSGAKYGAWVIPNTNAITPTWTLYEGTATSTAYVANIGLGIVSVNNTAQFKIDDFVVYAGTDADGVRPPEPTAPLISTAAATQQTISWSAPAVVTDVSGYMVVRSTADPTTAPNTKGIYAVGNFVAGTEKVVYLGPVGTNSFVDNGLTQETTYYYRIYTVDKAFNYCLTPLALSGTTTAPSYATEPTIAASNITITNASQTGFNISWIAGNGNNSVVVVKAGSAVDDVPVDGGTYNASSVFTGGAQIGTGNYVVYNGNGNSVTISGLNKLTRYYVKVYTFNGSGGSENYYVINPPSQNAFTLPGEFTSNGSGNWSTAATWTNNAVPGQNDNVTIAANHIISFTTGAKCYNLTIPATAKVWATSSNTLGIYGTSLLCDGTLGDSSNTASILTLEFGGNLTISGAGGIYPFKLRPITGLTDIGVTFDANATVTGTGSTVIFDNVGNDNIYYTVNSPRTLNIFNNFNSASGSATQSTSNNTLTINSGATVNVGGVLNTNEAAGKTYTANINGTLAVTGTSTLSGTSGGGSVVFNINGTYTSTGDLKVTPTDAFVAPVINVGSTGSITVAGTADFSNPNLVGYIGNAPTTTGGIFTLSSTGSIKLANASGLEPIAGPIRTTTRNFTSGSSYSFVGNVAQVTGSEMPSEVGGLTINNTHPDGVTLTSSSNVNGSLLVSSGTLITGSNLFRLGISATATFSPTSALSISGGVTNFNDRPVTFQSAATGTAQIKTITGALFGATNVTVERYIPAKRAWRALTSPVSTTTSIFTNWQENGANSGAGNGVNGFDIWMPGGSNGLTAGGSSNSLLEYNSANNTWTGITATNGSSSMMNGNKNKPFMAFVTGPFGFNNVTAGATATTIRATGTLFTGNQTYANTATQYSFIGNPYASPLDPSLLLADTDNTAFEGNIWVWDANATGSNSVGTYNLFNNGTYSNVTSNPAVTTGTQIQSGQAFFVKSTTGGTFTIKETHKGTTFSNAVFRTAAPELFRVGLYKQENNEWSGRDGAMTVILSDANANQSPNKMVNSTENIAFTKNGASFASNHHLPLVSSDVLNVKVWNTTVGANYKLKINTEAFTATNLSATLEDLFTNSRTPLNLEGTAVEYPFTVTNEALSSGDRFRIVFQNAVLGNNNPTENGFSIVPNPVTGDSFQVNLGALAIGTYSYSICNSLGQEIEKGSIQNATQNNNYDVKMSNVATGIYIMKIKGSDNSVFTAKIIKK